MQEEKLKNYKDGVVQERYHIKELIQFIYHPNHLNQSM